jgi:hypothetical protein
LAVADVAAAGADVFNVALVDSVGAAGWVGDGGSFGEREVLCEGGGEGGELPPRRARFCRKTYCKDCVV